MINMNNDTIKNLINIVIHKNMVYENALSLMIQNQMNQELFLQKKRFLENPNLNYNNSINFQNNNNEILNKNNILQMNEYRNNYEQNFNLGSQFISPIFPNYIDYYNLKVQEANNNSFNHLNLRTKDNKIENNFINYDVNNVHNNLNGNQTNGFLNNYFNFKNNKENIIDNFNDNYNSTDSSNSAHLSNNSTTKKNNFFNVSHLKNEKSKKKNIKKNISNSENNNNEIKVLKNNKVVYVNTFLLNSYSTSKNIKKLNKIAFIGRNKRSSRYRGVSKNGNQWQVLMMINKNKSYIGSYPSEELAARIYDILALKNRGIKARTNFIYNSNQIKKICDVDIDIKSKNIHDIISNLIV